MITRDAFNRRSGDIAVRYKIGSFDMSEAFRQLSDLRTLVDGPSEQAPSDPATMEAVFFAGANLWLQAHAQGDIEAYSVYDNVVTNAEFTIADKARREQLLKGYESWRMPDVVTDEDHGFYMRSPEP